MESLRRYLLPLAAIALVLAGMGLYRWQNSDLPPPGTSAVTSSITGDGRPTLVEFGMNICASCKAMHRVLDELNRVHGERLRIIRVNILEQSELTSQWKIMAIPTQVFLDGAGKELYRHMGFLSAQAVRDSFAARGLPLGTAGDES
jgi:thioredoxin 1